MKIKGVILSSFQTNFVKELMGDTYMTDVRAEATLEKICNKYGVDALAVLVTASKDFEVRHADFKKQEAAELNYGS